MSMRLVAHIAKVNGGKKGDVRRTLCGKARRIRPDGPALVGCTTCLRALLQVANAGRSVRSYTVTTTVTSTRVDNDVTP